jgi:hypothetical protein
MTTIPVFVAPSFESVLKRRLQIPFISAIAANTQLTLVSARITFPFVIVGVEIVFRDDAANNLLEYVLLSGNTNTSTTAVPPDLNAFSQYAPNPYFIGEGVVKRADCYVYAPSGYQFVKVHTVNNNAYAQTVNVTVTIEEVIAQT